MKKILIIFALISFNLVSHAQIGIGTTNPNENSILHIQSHDKGVIFPSVPLMDTSLPFPMQDHVSGMVVYNYAERNDVEPGLYVNDGTKWLNLGSTKKTPKEMFKLMDKNVRLTSTEFVDLISFDFEPNYSTTLVSFSLAGSGFTQSVNAIVIQVQILDSSGTVVASFMDSTHMQDKSDNATATGWTSSVANYALAINNFSAGNTYTYKLQAAIGRLYGPLEATIRPLSHPYHIGNLYVRDVVDSSNNVRVAKQVLDIRDTYDIPEADIGEVHIH